MDLTKPYDLFSADAVYTDLALKRGVAVAIERDGGRIVAVDLPEKLYSDQLCDEHVFAGRVLLPGCVNTHSHAFQILLRGRADHAPSFRHWVDDHMYPLVLSLEDQDLEASVLLAFATMALHGITTVGEFTYLHNDKGTFAERGRELDQLIIACAKRVGLRLVLVRALYDQAGREGRRRFVEPIDQALGAAAAVHKQAQTDPLLELALAPHSLHGASSDMIRAAHELAVDLDCPLHIHLAEQQHDLVFANEHFGTSPLRALETLGVVDEHLVVVHGVWLDEAEWQLLGSRGGGLAYNPLSNMFLGDGVANLEAAVSSGVCVSLGCDGPGGNNSLNPFLEMRAAELLQRVSRHRMGVLPAICAGKWGSNPMFTMGTANAARNLGFNGGEIEVGAVGDLIAVDARDLSLQPHHGLETESFLNNLVYAGEVGSALTDVVVGGKLIVRDRELVHVDRQALLAGVRAWEARTG